MLLNCGVGEDSWEFLGLQGYPTSPSRKSVLPGYSLKDWCWTETLIFGHLMKRTDSLEKTLMLGKIEGGKRRGQQRMRWLDGITDSMGLSLKLKTILNSHSSSDFQSVSLWIYRFVWIIIRLLWCSNCSQLAIGSPLKWVHVLLVGLHCSFNASSLPDTGQLRPPLAPRGFLLILVHVPLGDGLSSLLFWLSLWLVSSEAIFIKILTGFVLYQ